MSVQDEHKKSTKEFEKRLARMIAIETAISTAARKKQREIYSTILEDVILLLDKDDNGNIKNTARNSSVIQNVSKIFKKQGLDDIAKIYSEGVDEVLKSTHTQFSNFGRVSSDFRKRTQDRIKTSLGVVGKKIVEDSFLDSAITLQPLKQKIQNEFFKAANGTQSLQTLKENIKSISLGNKSKKGVLENHVNTFVNDSINQVSNSANSIYADELGFDAFFYSGSIKDNTRDFCEVRSGQVITRAEALKWGTSQDNLGGYTNKAQGQFQGKNANYNPLVDIGGHNCRHHLNWIPNELAVIERKDLVIKNGKLIKIT